MLTEQQRNQAILDLIGNSNEAMAKIAKLRADQYKRNQEIEAQLPSVLDSLVDNRCIAPSERQKVASWLRNPASALKVLKKVAESRTKYSSNSLGSVYKTANSNNTGSSEAERYRARVRSLGENLGIG